jgi:hypothetical protein
VLSTVQQVGGAAGVAIAGVIFFGLIGANAHEATNATAPSIRASLAALHLPPAATDRVLSGYQRCFDDRTHAADPTTVPASCRPPAGASPSVTRVLSRTAPATLGRDFSRSFQQALIYQIVVFIFAALLVFRLPRVDPHRMDSPGGGPPG